VVLLWVFYAEVCYHKGEVIAALQCLKYASKIAVAIPHHSVCMVIFEHQGVLNLAISNYQGAIKAFQRMRDVAEECHDREYEMLAYFHLGQTLQKQ
jgi:tetratricopeptide (TPR) repeat protein